MADPRDPKDVPSTPQEGGQQSRETSGGSAPIGSGRGYGRDFGAAGRNQGFDGSHGEGYGGAVAPSDYREGFGGEAYGGGMSGGDYERSQGGRGEAFGGDDQSWMDRRAEERMQNEGPHRGRGPQGWSRSDDRIREDVSEALTQDRLLDARGIEVTVADGVVTLSGEVASHGDVRLAEMLARGCSGAKDVRTELQVDPGRRDTRPELGSRTRGYAPTVRNGEVDEAGRRQGPWPSPSGSL